MLLTLEPVPLLHEGPSDVLVWRVDIRFDAALSDPAFASLTDDERARAHKFRRHEDALRFATTRAALCQLLARNRGVDNARAVNLISDANGRPRLDGSAALDFNVSHAGAYGLIALSAVRRVGVDIEQNSDSFDWRSIASLTLHPDESAEIERLETTRQMIAFYEAWTAKEALVKTTGVGITRGLQHISVLARERAAVSLRDPVPADLHGLAAQWIAAPQGYAACVAWSESRETQ